MRKQYRMVQWMTEETLEIRYGIQCRLEGKGKWMHCYVKDQPLLYKTVEDCSDAILALKKDDKLKAKAV